jgi:hypothetical protein
MLNSGPYLRLHSEFEAEKAAFDAKSRCTPPLHKMDLKLLFASRRFQQMLLFWRSALLCVLNQLLLATPACILITSNRPGTQHYSKQ